MLEKNLQLVGPHPASRSRPLFSRRAPADSTRRRQRDPPTDEKCIFEKCIFENFANFWRARSRLYQNEKTWKNHREEVTVTHSDGRTRCCPTHTQETCPRLPNKTKHLTPESRALRSAEGGLASASQMNYQYKND